MNEEQLLKYKDFSNRRSSFLSASEGNALSSWATGACPSSINETAGSGNGPYIAGLDCASASEPAEAAAIAFGA